MFSRPEMELFAKDGSASVIDPDIHKGATYQYRAERVFRIVLTDKHWKSTGNFLLRSRSIYLLSLTKNRQFGLTVVVLFPSLPFAEASPIQTDLAIAEWVKWCEAALKIIHLPKKSLETSLF